MNFRSDHLSAAIGLPIACSLSAIDYQQRMQLIAKLGRTTLLEHTETDGQHTLRFHPGHDTRTQLDDIARAEAACCAFLNLNVHEASDELVLTIAAPASAEALAADLAAAFEA